MGLNHFPLKSASISLVKLLKRKSILLILLLLISTYTGKNRPRFLWEKTVNQIYGLKPYNFLKVPYILPENIINQTTSNVRFKTVKWFFTSTSRFHSGFIIVTWSLSLVILSNNFDNEPPLLTDSIHNCRFVKSKQKIEFLIIESINNNFR